ncbi:MAG: YihY/virulence factor BrkB family protein [Propionibacteriaceae bacterium]|nr:YihY/virulence factor BrkB family protein [Propionibacteriaceae bacterium]
MSEYAVKKSQEKAQEAPHPEDDRKPDDPTDLTKPSWKYIGKRAVSEFSKDQCTDLAAGLTYFAVLSLFPALLALVSLLGVFGQGEQTTQAIVGWLNDYAPKDLQALLETTITNLTSQTGAGLALVTGLVGALWTASGYVGAFGRSMNRIYEIEEGRPVWKLKPTMLLLTFVMLIIVAVIVFAVALSGGVAEAVGGLIGLGGTALLVWNIAKWPVVVGLAVLLIALLYYFTPNVRQPKFRWISMGSIVALVVSAIAVAGFAFYVSKFSSYSATYGIIGSVIILLLGIWIVNNVLLLGAEIDAEVERGRELQGGIKAEESVQLPLRDDRQVNKQAKKLDALVEEGAELREQHSDVDYTEQGDDSDHTGPDAGDGVDGPERGGAHSAR